MKIKKAPFIPFYFLTFVMSHLMANQNAHHETIMTDTHAYTVNNNQTPSQSAMRSLEAALKKLKIRSEFQSRSSVYNLSITRDIIKLVYNDANYPALLSQDGSHIVEFCTLSNELNLSTNQTTECLRLYYNKLKECEYIDDNVVLSLIQAMPQALERHFSNPMNAYTVDLETIKQQTEDCILSKLTENFRLFEKDPVIFVTSLAETISHDHYDQIVNQARDQSKRDDVAQLRSLVVRFFELIIGKMTWTEPSERSWSTFKNLGNALHELATYGIIEHMDDLDDLYMTLTARTRFLIDLTASGLPLALYDAAITDLDNDAVCFLELPEQDAHIMTKKELLMRSLNQGKCKAIAYLRGFPIDNPLDMPSHDQVKHEGIITITQDT